MHIEITIEANEHQQEELISLLNDFNPEGYEQNDHALIAYFPAKEYNASAVEQILHGFDHKAQEVHEQNWNKVWESNFDPVVVGNFCAIRAEFHQPIQGVKHEIVITPKMSFGTGHHATTYMMIEQMKDLDFTGKKVFDFGTGTGILAILSEKLGATEVIAIDVDDWSIENAHENLYRNSCSYVKLSLNSSVPDRQFDIILANINRNVILQYHLDLIRANVKKGYILLSGLLKTDKEQILAAFLSQGLTLEKELEKNNWISLLFQK